MNIFKQTTIYQVIPLTLIMVVFFVVYFSIQHTLMAEDFDEDADAKAYALGVTSHNILLSKQYVDFDHILNGYLSLNNVAAIRVFDEKNQLIASRTKNPISIKTLPQKIAYAFYGNEVLTGSSIIIQHQGYNADSLVNKKIPENKIVIGKTEVDLANYINYSYFLSEIATISLFLGLFLIVLICKAYNTNLLTLYSLAYIKGKVEGSTQNSANKIRPFFYSRLDEFLDLHTKYLDDNNISKIESEKKHEKDKALLQESINKLTESNNQLKTSYFLSIQFLASISHDFRSLISGIVMQANLLLKGSLQDDQLDRCHHIEDVTNQLLDLVDDILDFSRLESSVISAKIEPVDLIGIIERKLVDARASINGKRIFICYLANANMPNYIFLDENLISRILSNLLANAIKYSDEGDIVLSVQAKDIGDDNKFTLRIEVSDEGVGIPKDKIERIFDNYYQENTANSGVGLGLSICKSLVEGMGGKIGVESIKYFGSTFWFELPSTIHSYKSDAQNKISKSLISSNIDLAIFHPHPVLLQSIVSQFELLGITAAAYINMDSLSISHDVILGYDLSNQSTKLLKLKNHANYIVSLESDSEKNIDQIDKGDIDLILDHNTTIYRSAQRIIQLVQRGKLPFIGHKKQVESSAISNPLMDIIAAGGQKILDGIFILVVDSNKYSRTGVSDTLKYLGAKIEVASTVLKAKSMINKTKYNLVITEFNLNDGNGTDIVEIAHHSLCNFHTRVFCITGDVITQANPIYQDAFESILIKPLNEDFLVKLILNPLSKINTNEDKTKV